MIHTADVPHINAIKSIKLPSYLDVEFHIVPVVKIQLFFSLLSLFDASLGLSQSKQKVHELTLSFIPNKTTQLNHFLEKGEKYFSNFLLFISHYLLKLFTVPSLLLTNLLPKAQKCWN